MTVGSSAPMSARRKGFRWEVGTGRYLQILDSDEKKTLHRSDCNGLLVGVRALFYSIILKSGFLKLVMRSENRDLFRDVRVPSYSIISKNSLDFDQKLKLP
ncbi:hypothetical protein [Cohaesibacter intestini]|uniref:hypothetical protein n=1 Tax=Cohaesibacter intestini TaxID=2211145 RepID=UPI00130028EE|nr:hypothetical protein [Cohaesibacter intestini]